MTSRTVQFSRYIKRPRLAQRTRSNRGILRSFRYYIETSAWDEKVLIHEKWGNRICIGIIIAAALYLLPLSIRVFLR